MRNTAKFIAALFAFAMCAAVSAEARSIESVSRRVTEGKMFLDVKFAAGSEGDNHALYIAYDMEDKGDNILAWDELQRGCVVAADATSATIPVSPLLTDRGYTVCRVFLTTSAAPYDTLIEYLRQGDKQQYIDTGIKPDGKSVVATIDAKLDSNAVQQRFFGVSSDDTTAKFSFDCYVNSSGYFASSCLNGKVNKKSTDKITTDRVLISLSAAEKHRIIITNLKTGSLIYDKKYTTTCSETSIANLLVFAQNHVSSSSATSKNFAKNMNLYGFTLTQGGSCVCDYKPCMLGGRAGVYDSVTERIIDLSPNGIPFDAANSGSPVACSLLKGEEQVSVSSSAIELLSDYVWSVTTAEWHADNVWKKDSFPAPWVDGNYAIFRVPGAEAELTSDVAAKKLVFEYDATVSGLKTLIAQTVQVDPGVAATISAPTAGALEKTGAGTLTLAANRTDATTVTEGTLKMDGATVAGLTLGTYGGAPVVFDYGRQELVKNPQDYLVTGSTVTLTNGVFSRASGDLNLRDDLSETVLPSVLTIAQGTTLRETSTGSGNTIYICKAGDDSATINIAGGVFEKTGGSKEVFIQHKSVSGRVNINVTDGGRVSFPAKVYALCRGDVQVTSPKLYMTFVDSCFRVGGAFEFGSSWGDNQAGKAPKTPTGVFAATNSVISIGGAFNIGRNNLFTVTDGSLTADFENCTVTAKTFAVYYDRPLNNARFNGSRFVFNAAGGSIAASDDEANWFTIGDDGLIIDTQGYSATLNANFGGSGAVTKTGTGTLTVSRNQTTADGFKIEEGALRVDGAVAFSGTIEFAKDAALDIANYVGGVTPLSAAQLKLPDGDGAVSLTLDGGEFGEAAYVICSAPGVSAADGNKFSVVKADDLLCNWSVDGDKLILTVGQVPDNYWTGFGGDDNMSNPDNWGGRKVPTAGTDIDFSGLSGDTTIIADVSRTFGAVTMGAGVITFSGDFAATSFSDTSKITVGPGATVKIDGDLAMDDQPTDTIVNKVDDDGKFIVTRKIVANGKHVEPTKESSLGYIIVGGIEIGSNKYLYTSKDKTEQKWVVGAQGISGAGALWCRLDNANKTYVYADTSDFTVSAYTVLRGDQYFITTGFSDDLPHTIKLNAGIAGSGDLFVAGSGNLVVNFEPLAGTIGDYGAFNDSVMVQDTATLAINAGKTLTTTGTITVKSGATFLVAESAASAGMASVTLGGNLTLNENACLGFNFTDRRADPVLAIAEGKSVILSKSGKIAVKISGDVWPVGGEHVLTTCGGFKAEGVTLVSGAPKWATGILVNEEGNIVLTVRPKATMIIVR